MVWVKAVVLETSSCRYNSMAVLSCACVRFCGTVFVSKNGLWDYHIVFIGVWGIVVIELQVPSSIV